MRIKNKCMNKQELIIDFLEWMNEVVQNSPMRLETDNDDIAIMYLKEKNFLDTPKPLKPIPKQCISEDVDMFNYIVEVDKEASKLVSKHGILAAHETALGNADACVVEVNKLKYYNAKKITLINNKMMYWLRVADAIDDWYANGNGN